MIEGFKFVGFRGLASHGATIGIICAMFLYKRKFKFNSVLWIFDRIVIPISIGGMFVRIGNFFNSEIVGNYTGNNFGIIFQTEGKYIPDTQPNFMRHIGYLILFILLRYIYWNTNFKDKKGFIFGLFLICLFQLEL